MRPTSESRRPFLSASWSVRGLSAALGLALVLSAAWTPGGPAVAQTSLPAPARDRVAFAPAMRGFQAFGRDYGLKVQNLGQAPARFLLLAQAPEQDPPAAGCAECPRFTAVCSPLVAPGTAWTFFPAGGGAVVYSLSGQPASAAGEAWSAFARGRGLPADTALADLACAAIGEAAGPFQGAAPTPTAMAVGGGALGEAIGPIGPVGRIGPIGSMGTSGPMGLVGSVHRIGPMGPFRPISPIRPIASIDAIVSQESPGDTPPSLDCTLYRAFHGAYLGGGAMTELLPGLPLDVLRGQPLAAAAAFEMPTVDEKGAVTAARPALDREAAVSLSDAGADPAAASAGPFVYLLPGVFLETPEWQQGLVWLQGASADCAAVTVEAFRGGQGQLPGKRELAVAAGAVVRFRPAESWADHAAATLRVTSDRPLAVMASELGYHTSASFNASLLGPEPMAWAIPLAYQEPKPLPPLAGGLVPAPPPSGGRPPVPVAVWPAAPAPPPSGGRPGGGLAAAPFPGPAVAAAPLAPAPADGRRTQVAAFNNGAAWDNLQMDTQAEGQDPRSQPLGIPPQSQLLFELGFGLGRAGGEGWARLASQTMPMAAAFYGYRLATGEEAATETWAAPAWRYDAASGAVGPRTIALPAPAARFDYWEQRDENAPVARIALQNLGPGRARLAVDSYDALCGFNGSRELTLPPFEARLLPVDELPGAHWRDISAVVRVLEGEAAAQLEVARPHGFPITDFPTDRADALLGVPLMAELPPPAAREALLELTPPLIGLARPLAPVSRPVALRDSLDSGRCLSFEAQSSAPWLTANAYGGLLPADLLLTIDPALLPPGRQVAELTVRVPEANVLGSPAKVTVVVEAANRVALWLPRLGKGTGEAVP